MEARGTFEVTVTPAEATAFERAMGASRYELVKDWNGDFVGTSKGEMLSSPHRKQWRDGLRRDGGSGQVSSEEKHGSFYFAHRATMTKGDAALRRDAHCRSQGFLELKTSSVYRASSPSSSTRPASTLMCSIMNCRQK